MQQGIGVPAFLHRLSFFLIFFKTRIILKKNNFPFTLFLLTPTPFVMVFTLVDDEEETITLTPEELAESESEMIQSVSGMYTISIMF